MKRVADGLAAWLLVGALGWAGVAFIGWTMWQLNPPRAGFDLALLLEAARRVTASVAVAISASLVVTAIAITWDAAIGAPALSLAAVLLLLATCGGSSLSERSSSGQRVSGPAR